MSRIGKKPVVVPDKVDVKIDGQTVKVKGPKGDLSFTFSDKVSFKKENKSIIVSPKEDDPESPAHWGMARSIVHNMVFGVTEGFVKTLEFNGVGYKAQTTSDTTLVLNMGHSHPIEYNLPKGITAKVNKNLIEIHGSNKELVGFVAAKIKSFRPPEPYKGKGIRYKDEFIIRKVGKTGAKGK